jgi:hypothetical protein
MGQNLKIGWILKMGWIQIISRLKIFGSLDTGSWKHELLASTSVVMSAFTTAVMSRSWFNLWRMLFNVYDIYFQHRNWVCQSAPWFHCEEQKFRCKIHFPCHVQEINHVFQCCEIILEYFFCVLHVHGFKFFSLSLFCFFDLVFYCLFFFFI